MAAVKAVAMASRRVTLILTALRSAIDRTLLLSDGNRPERTATVGIAKPSAGVTTAAIRRTTAQRLMDIAIFAGPCVRENRVTSALYVGGVGGLSFKNEKTQRLTGDYNEPCVLPDFSINAEQRSSLTSLL
jgi:hypothetical protein